MARLSRTGSPFRPAATRAGTARGPGAAAGRRSGRSARDDV